MTTHEVLVRARNLIAMRRTGRGRADDGRSLVPMCRLACARFDYALDPLRALVVAAGIEVGCMEYPTIEVQNWNDSHSHAEVLAAFDKAIAQTAPEPDTEFLNNVAEPVAA
jgi:hypothetical protein